MPIAAFFVRVVVSLAAVSLSPQAVANMANESPRRPR
jgi:hypothetical protein